MLALLMGAVTSAWSTDYITDVMLVGDTENLSFISDYQEQGWIKINSNLTEGAGGSWTYSIYLLYKAETGNGENLDDRYITDFYVKISESSDHPETISHEGRTYYPVQGGGSDSFNNTNCDLNAEAGGNFVFLYYTKDKFDDNRVVTGIYFNSDSNGAVCSNGGTSAADLNSGSGGNYIYMHLTTTSVTNKYSHAIWCKGNNTLYFTVSEEEYTKGDTFDGQTITSVIDNTSNTGTDPIEGPGWNGFPFYSIKDDATRVVFDASYADARPKSLNRWFSNFDYLETIEGIENLNTSECTNMYATFVACGSLETIDVSGFDVSNVTNAKDMFSYCYFLTTIYCNDTWTISNSDDMFMGSTQLKGAVAYNDNYVTGEMANPATGYFTGKWDIILSESEHATISADKSTCYTNETVTVTGSADDEHILSGLIVKGNRTGNEKVLTNGGNGTFTFTMPAEAVTITAVVTPKVPYVVYCNDVRTLYFDFGDVPAVDDTYSGHTVTAVWSGDDVTDTPVDDNVPGWNVIDYRRDITSVVFEPSFAYVRPKSTASWFREMGNLSRVTGLEYLNTSQVTSMYCMFHSCYYLTSLDISNFDLSSLTRSAFMFYEDMRLTTLYSNADWNSDKLADSEKMFYHCTQLKGAVAYSYNLENDATQANPKTGYFTGKWAVNIPSSFEHGTVTCENDWAYTNETVTLTITPDNGYQLESLTVDSIGDGSPSGAPLLAPRRVEIGAIPGDEPGTYIFTMPAAPVSVNATFKPAVNYGTLEQLLAGEDIGAINEDLHIGEAFVDDNMVYVADAESNWIGLKVTDDAMTEILESNNKVLKANTVLGIARDLDTNPVFEVTGVPELVEGTAALPVEINLSEVFSDITGNTLVKISGYYKGNRFTAYQSDTEGQSLAINSTYMGTVDLVYNQRYNVCGVLRLKATWDAASDGAPRRVAASNPDYFKNMEIVPYDVDIVTGVEDLNAAQPKPGQRYNLLGQPVSNDYKGIVIQNGKKVIVR